MTDAVVCERDTVGSGGTGKSSGVVRCHYGVSDFRLSRFAEGALLRSPHPYAGAGEMR